MYYHFRSESEKDFVGGWNSNCAFADKQRSFQLKIAWKAIFHDFAIRQINNVLCCKSQTRDTKCMDLIFRQIPKNCRSLKIIWGKTFAN